MTPHGIIGVVKKLIIILFIVNILLVGKILFLPQQAISVTPKASPTPTDFPSQGPFDADRLFQLVNNWRIENGYQPLIKSDFACKIANIRLPQIKEVFSHIEFLRAMKNNEYCKDCSLGENLAENYYYQPDEKKALNDWIASPSHKANLTSTYTHACIVADQGYIVNIFSYF